MIPLRTDTPVRGTPLTNYVLIVLNLFVYLVFDGFGRESLEGFKMYVLSLDGVMPQWWQFFSYQFLHGDMMHLASNMLFLWVFGNSVNSKLGNFPYLLFYLAAGAFAGWGFCISHDAPVLGASGAVAGITTAYMVLFPRSRILFLFFIFIITWFELPCLWVILFKVVLWDNVIAPAVLSSGDGIAYEAHLYGYFFGFVATMAMLLFGALSRDQFDLPSVLKRWNQRRSFSAARSDPQAQVRGQYGTVARAITMSPQKQQEIEARMTRMTELRGQIHDALTHPRNDLQAIEYYEQLICVHSDQCLPRQQQLEIARIFYSQQKFPQAAAAFEKYLKQYPKAPEHVETRLLVGIIYARDLSQYEAAEGHLKSALDSLTDESRRAQCQQWLDRVTSTLGSAPADGA